MEPQQLNVLSESVKITQVKKKLDYNPPKLQILRYMGNKRALLEWLLPELISNIDNGDTLLDLFAGTSSVGYALKPKFRIIANDVQEYATEISRALLVFNKNLNHDSFTLKLSDSYSKNYKVLNKIYGKAVFNEEKYLKSNDYTKYFKFAENLPSFRQYNTKDKYSIRSYCTDEYIAKKRHTPDKFPYNLFSAYFLNNFFGLKQCIEIDSLRYSIEQITDKAEKSVYLSCLLYSISKAVNSSGHFAEYMNPHSESTMKLIIERRKVSIMDQFLSKLDHFTRIYKQKAWINKVYNMDYIKLIQKLKNNGELNDVKLIYIDPPYTTAQYSRYYHIPETLIKYDYPEINDNKITKEVVKGRYRGDRHQSTFSQITKAESSFREMFRLLSSSSNATLAISYSDNSIVKPIDNLIKIAKEFYTVTDIKNGYSHSAQGSKFSVSGKGLHEIHEYLLICKPKT